jgi:quercetin dioxygenase-like cupin family protein
MSAHIDWSSHPAEDLSPKIRRQFVSQPGMTLARFELKRGAVVPQHQHVSAQVTNVLEGALRFLMEGKETVVSTGETIFIASNIPHEVHVEKDSLVLDIFTPERSDWAAGGDAYLRK